MVDGRTAAAVVGGVALAGALVLLLTGTTVPWPLGEAPLVFGGIALVATAWLAFAQWGTSALDAVPNPDGAPLPRNPGAIVDREIDDGRLADLNDVQSRLRHATVTALVRRLDIPEPDAWDRLEDGSWTDDELVGEFLAGKGVVREAVTAGQSTPQRETNGWTGQRFRHAVERSLAAIQGVDVQPSRSNRPEEEGPYVGAENRAETGATWPTVDGTGTRHIATWRTGYWRGAVVLSVAFVAVGLLVSRPALVAPAVVTTAVAAYGASTGTQPPDLAVERSIDATRPDPGDSIEVTVTVTNEGDATLSDCRLADGVPEGLPVTDTARQAATLGPGESTRWRYTLVARLGTHRFRPLVARVRDISNRGATDVAVGANDRIVCRPAKPLNAAGTPLNGRFSRFVGEHPSSSGSGIEFDELREYESGDPLRRIAWRRLASHRELATIDFREERAATVLIAVDARADADLAPSSADPSAFARGIDAALAIMDGLLGEHHSVGLAALGPETAWIRPGRSGDHVERVRVRLGREPAFRDPPAEGVVDTTTWLRDLRRRYPPATQVVLVTPLCDETMLYFALRLRAYGHPVTLVSPDPTTTDTLGGRVVATHRRLRLARLRRAGVPTVDWGWTEPLALAVDREARRRGGS